MKDYYQEECCYKKKRGPRGYPGFQGPQGPTGPSEFYLQYSSNSIPPNDFKSPTGGVFVGQGFYRNISTNIEQEIANIASSESQLLLSDALVTQFAFISQYTGILDQPINVLASLIYFPPESSTFNVLANIEFTGVGSGDVEVRFLQTDLSAPVERGGRLTTRFLGNGISFASQFKSLNFIPTLKLIKL